MRTEFYYPSSGAGTIYGCRWEPEGKPVAVLQIVHGLGGHCMRYDHLAQYFAAKGFLVVAQDHMGHGRSTGPQCPRACLEGGWGKAVADVHRLLKTTRLEYPELPYFLLGHSMGSFLIRSLLIQYPKCGISGAILCGTGWIHRGMLNSAIAGATMAGRINGFRKPSVRLTETLFGAFNRKVEHPRTTFDWLSRSSKIVDRYMEDSLCFHHVTPCLVREMMSGMKFNQEPKNLQQMKKDLPILLISGGDDPVGNYGEGVKKTVQAFTAAGMENVSMRLFPLCRHELLSEINRDEVYRFVEEWMQKQS